MKTNNPESDQLEENGYARTLKGLSKLIVFISIVGALSVWVFTMVTGKSYELLPSIPEFFGFIVTAIFIGGFGEIINLLQMIYNELQIQNRQK